MPEIKIVGKQVVVVDKVDAPNDYGDVYFTDKGVTTHKIGKKRIELAKKLIPGRAVELGYGEYKEKKFIATVSLVDLPGEKPVTTPGPVPAPVPVLAPPQPPRNYGRSEVEVHSIEAQVAVKAITDLEVAGKPLNPQLPELRDRWLVKVLEGNWKVVAKAEPASDKIDMDWLTASLKKLGKNFDMATWANANFGLTGTPEEIVGKMIPGQRLKLCAKVKENLALF